MPDMSDDRKLLQFSVGPVSCCADSISIYRIIEPPEHLVHLPGHTEHPAIFRHQGRLVSVIDMRSLFGLTVSSKPSGTEKLIIVEMDDGLFGYWVDQVSTIVSESMGKWGFLPSVVPRTLFDAAFSIQGKLILHVDFTKLVHVDVTPWVYESGLYPEPGLAHEEKPEKVAHPEETGTNPARKSAPVIEERSVGSKEPVKDSKSTRYISEPSKAKAKDQVEQKPVPPVKLRPQKDRGERVVKSVTPVQRPLNKSQVSDAVPVTEPASSLDADAELPEMIQEPLEQKKSWFVPAAIGFVILLGIGYWAFYLFSFPDEFPEVAQDSSSIQLAEPARPEVSSTYEGRNEKVAVPEQGMSTAPVVKEESVRPTEIEAPEEYESKPEGITNISRDGDTVTITVYEDINTDTIEEQPAPVVETRDTKAQALVSESKIETPEQVEATTGDDLVIIWRSETQSLVDASDTYAPSAELNGRMPGDAESVSMQPLLTVDEISHIVVRGDTLWAIAKRYINDPFRYPELARLSKIENPDLIYPGDRVLIRIIRQVNGR